MDVAGLILKARHGSGLSQRALAEKAGTSQATLSTYERGVKTPSLRGPSSGDALEDGQWGV